MYGMDFSSRIDELKTDFNKLLNVDYFYTTFIIVFCWAGLPFICLIILAVLIYSHKTDSRKEYENYSVISQSKQCSPDSNRGHNQEVVFPKPNRDTDYYRYSHTLGERKPLIESKSSDDYDYESDDEKNFYSNNSGNSSEKVGTDSSDNEFSDFDEEMNRRRKSIPWTIDGLVF
jgi:hypothetical protein